MDHLTSDLGSDLTHCAVALSAGLTVRAYDVGQGPPVLLLHGNPDNADEFVGLLRLLRGRHRCLAPDLPGYGRAGVTYPLPRDYDYSREAQVRFVDELLDRCKVEDKVVLVVHDIGGIMGVPWAAANTGRLAGVVYTNTVAYPRFPWFGLARLFGARDAPLRWVATANMRLLGTLGGNLFRRQFGQQNPQLSAAELTRFTRDFALNPVAKETTQRQFWQITRPDFFDGYDQLVKKIAAEVPTVALWGEGDPYLSVSWAEQLHARRLEVLPGVGHWVPIIAAERVAQEIDALTRTPSGA